MEQFIGVTVVGGYLGSGKTTLVNHVLRTSDQRVAVLVNDFGSINIDAELIESQDANTISLANGCICCSLVDGFAGALATVRELDPQPQRLLIEASGVADPATVAAYGHGPGLMLDAVVVMVDAETVRARVNDKYVGDTVTGQLKAGDIIVINKTDLISADQLSQLRAWLVGLCPQAVLFDTTQAQIPAEVLFGIEPRPNRDRTSGPHRHHSSSADQIFESWTWSTPNPVSTATIEALMDDLPDGVVRAKGVVEINDGDQRPAVLQRVGKRWSMHRSDRLKPGPHQTNLIFIGMPMAITDQWLDAHLGS